MKGMQGLAVAAVLGLLGVGLNWVYLSQKTKDIDAMSFIGIAPGTTIGPGDVLRREHLVEVKIPRIHARNLEDFIYLWQDVETVVGIHATRQYQGGELVKIEDYRTPPPELALEENERLIWIAVDSRSFVPSLVDPGDQITFLVPRFRTTADSAGSDDSPEPIGPFTIGSLGNRLGSREVMRSGRRSPVQERQVGIIVQVHPKPGAAGEWELEAKAKTLLTMLQQSNYRNVGVALHPKNKN